LFRQIGWMSLNKHDNQTHHIAISVNDTFVKAYIDNKQVINDPYGITRPISYIGMMLSTGGRTSMTKNMMFRNFRIAEGGKNIKPALDTEGKIVTHGILFDSGSDRIKPESTATLKGILDILNGDPGLKFSVEGHTDNQGNKAANQPLSENRAAQSDGLACSYADYASDAVRTSPQGNIPAVDIQERAQ